MLKAWWYRRWLSANGYCPKHLTKNTLKYRLGGAGCALCLHEWHTKREAKIKARAEHLLGYLSNRTL